MSDAVVVFPFVPVTPIVGAGQRRSARSGSETSAGASGSPAATRAASASSAAWRRGSVVGKPGVIDGENATRAAPSHEDAGSTSGPARSRDRSATQLRQPIRQRGGGLPVVDRHDGARIDEEPGQPDPGAGQPEDRDGDARQRAGADGIGRQRVEVDRVRHRQTSRCRVARKSVTPSRPASAATIQKRSVIFVSGQPPSSKWWCSGLIRKIRFPWVTLK